MCDRDMCLIQYCLWTVGAKWKGLCTHKCSATFWLTGAVCVGCVAVCVLCMHAAILKPHTTHIHQLTTTGIMIMWQCISQPYWVIDWQTAWPSHCPSSPPFTYWYLHCVIKTQPGWSMPLFRLPQPSANPPSPCSQWTGPDSPSILQKRMDKQGSVPSAVLPLVYSIRLRARQHSSLNGYPSRAHIQLPTYQLVLWLVWPG